MSNSNELSRWLVLLDAKITYLLQKMEPGFRDSPEFRLLLESGESFILNPASGVLELKEAKVPKTMDLATMNFGPTQSGSLKAPWPTNPNVTDGDHDQG
jgi:hypothetical protein